MNRQAAAFIAEAERWIGYLEKETDDNLEDFRANAGDENYTVFGRWYGLNGYAWCAMFVSYAAWKAGIPESIIPKQKSCTCDGVAFFKKAGRWRPREGYMPQPGDLIYFTNDGGKTAAHVGIVCGADKTGVTTIEGNTNGGAGLVPNGGGVAKNAIPGLCEDIRIRKPGVPGRNGRTQGAYPVKMQVQRPGGVFRYLDDFNMPKPPIKNGRRATNRRQVMNEWAVVGVIVVLFGLIAAVVTPLLKLNTSITQLTCAVSVLQKNIEGLTTRNSESHAKLWEHIGKQDLLIADHETRLKIIENAERRV